ncbi:MAG: hypothetical protein LUG95_04595, partial [Clostridiales bacterium]|nr:hypothetical protein [Clostridiales bacterium]
MTYTCTTCGETKTEVISATGHTKDENIAGTVVPPTCTIQGYTEYTCSVCGETYQADYTDALGHTNGEAVKENEVSATCTANGSYDTVIYCSVCNTEISRETVTVPATGHTYDSGVVTTAATCTTAGVKTYTCTVCGATKNRSDFCHGHNYQIDVSKTVAATCTVNGSNTYICSRCGSSYTVAISAPGHTAGKAVIENLVAATADKNGSYKEVKYCTACGTVVESTMLLYQKSTLFLSKKTSYVYTGKKIKPAVTVTDANGNVVSSEYYIAKYKNNKKPGTATVTVTFSGNYSGTKTLKITIKPKGTKITKLTVGKNKFTVQWKKQSKQMTGYELQVSTSKKFPSSKVKTKTFTITDKKKISSDSYTVTYAKGRKNVGKYKVTVKFKGNYSGTKTLYFTVKPKATKLISIKTYSDEVVIKRKKQTKQVTGYEIQISTSKKFPSSKSQKVKDPDPTR